jgi:hypothetical protein
MKDEAPSKNRICPGGKIKVQKSKSKLQSRGGGLEVANDLSRPQTGAPAGKRRASGWPGLVQNSTRCGSQSRAPAQPGPWSVGWSKKDCPFFDFAAMNGWNDE